MRSPAPWPAAFVLVLGCAAAPARETAPAESAAPLPAASVEVSTIPSAARPAASTAPAAASAVAPWPGVRCDDPTAAANLRFFACTKDCDAKVGAACDTLGDLHAREEGLPEPAASAGPAARAWGKACELGASVACEKRDKLLSSLATRCRKLPAEGCLVEAEARLLLPGEPREAVDALFQRACSAGNGDGCARSGDLHSEWEPQSVHAPLALRAYEKSCALRSGEGCCALETMYAAKGQLDKVARVQQRMAGVLGYGCGRGDPVQPSAPQVEAKIKIDALSAANFSPEELSRVERTMIGRGRHCYAMTSSGKKVAGTARITLDVAPDGKVAVRDSRLTRSLPNELQQCLRQASVRLGFAPASAARSLHFELGFTPK